MLYAIAECHNQLIMTYLLSKILKRGWSLVKFSGLVKSVTKVVSKNDKSCHICSIRLRMAFSWIWKIWDCIYKCSLDSNLIKNLFLRWRNIKNFFEGVLHFLLVEAPRVKSSRRFGRSKLDRFVVDDTNARFVVVVCRRSNSTVDGYFFVCGVVVGVGWTAARAVCRHLTVEGARRGRWGRTPGRS